MWREVESLFDGRLVTRHTTGMESRVYARFFAVAFIGFISGIGVMAFAQFFATSNAGVPNTTPREPVVQEKKTATLVVHPQRAGSTTLAAYVRTVVPTWVTVHEIINGHVGNALGAALREQGTHDNIAVELLRNTTAGASYAAVLYEDDGDRVFELRTDIPIVDDEGIPVLVSFTTHD